MLTKPAEWPSLRHAVARPRKEINPAQVKQLAAIQCSYAEMAAVLGCDESTLTRRFAQVIKEGRETGKMSIKRKQYEIAMKGNCTMLIWLGKNILGQRDMPEENQTSQPSASVYKLHDTSKPDSKAG
jgi:hypothetical protein